jgi:type I restriction enzyme S subunit
MYNLITEHIDIWTSAKASKSNVGRGISSTNGQTIYGIKRLRELILELAVRGKLAPQDPNDESANTLLKKIKLERDQIIKDGKFKDTIDSPALNYKGLFDIPKNWCWCRLNDIAAIARGGSPRPIKSFVTDSPDGYNWIKIGDTDRKSRYIVKTEEKIKKEGLVKTRVVFPGDLILSNSMSYGFPYILKIKGCIHDGWLVIRTTEKLIDKLYLCYLFLSMHAKNSFDMAAAGAVVQNLNADKVRMLAVPLPPLNEQHRIVAKVDELMALCDQLEKQETENTETHQALVKTLLSTLTGAKDHKEFTETWNRIKEHFDILFTTEESIDQLKQTILQLAVMGKLVEQNPEDEPASELLKKIAKEKEKLIKEGKIKKQNPLPEISEDEKPFELPKTWEWTRRLSENSKIEHFCTCKYLNLLGAIFEKPYSRTVS